MKIVGIAGKDRSGKDSLAELFIKDGYFGFSFGDAVRRHARERHSDKPDPISVKNMTETSNWLRAQHGPDVLLKEALAEFEKAQKASGNYKGVVLYSVRVPVEVDFILEHGGELIWVESSDEIRYKRKIDNLRAGEANVTMEEMLAQEALQAKPQPGLPAEVQMDLSYVKAHATKVFENNNNDIEDFKRRAEKQFGLN
jgi:dephospho-CoA kinase